MTKFRSFGISPDLVSQISEIAHREVEGGILETSCSNQSTCVRDNNQNKLNRERSRSRERTLSTHRSKQPAAAGHRLV